MSRWSTSRDVRFLPSMRSAAGGETYFGKTIDTNGSFIDNGDYSHPRFIWLNLSTCLLRIRWNSAFANGDRKMSQLRTVRWFLLARDQRRGSRCKSDFPHTETLSEYIDSKNCTAPRRTCTLDMKERAPDLWRGHSTSSEKLMKKEAKTVEHIKRRYYRHVRSASSRK